MGGRCRKDMVGACYRPSLPFPGEAGFLVQGEAGKLVQHVPSREEGELQKAEGTDGMKSVGISVRCFEG